MVMSMKLIDRVGHTYGRLKVLSRAPNASKADTNARWNCQCECGKFSLAYGQDLAKGKVKSCGCLNAEQIKKHGHSRKPVYSVWRQLFQRCENPDAPSYKNYGARGITVCDEWRDFNVFLADMGFPAKGMTLDRIDNSKGYSKQNCRWATYGQQTNNSRANVRLELNGKTRTMAEWAKHLNISRDSIHGRLRRGWSVEMALSKPVKPKPPRKAKS
jgi:hypothetical protein